MLLVCKSYMDRAYTLKQSDSPLRATSYACLLIDFCNIILLRMAFLVIFLHLNRGDLSNVLCYFIAPGVLHPREKHFLDTGFSARWGWNSHRTGKYRFTASGGFWFTQFDVGIDFDMSSRSYSSSVSTSQLISQPRCTVLSPQAFRDYALKAFMPVDYQVQIQLP